MTSSLLVTTCGHHVTRCYECGDPRLCEFEDAYYSLYTVLHSPCPSEPLATYLTAHLPELMGPYFDDAIRATEFVDRIREAVLCLDGQLCMRSYFISMGGLPRYPCGTAPPFNRPLHRRLVLSLLKDPNEQASALNHYYDWVAQQVSPAKPENVPGPAAQPLVQPPVVHEAAPLVEPLVHAEPPDDSWVFYSEDHGSRRADEYKANDDVLGLSDPDWDNLAYWS